MLAAIYVRESPEPHDTRENPQPVPPAILTPSPPPRPPRYRGTLRGTLD